MEKPNFSPDESFVSVPENCYLRCNSLASKIIAASAEQQEYTWNPQDDNPVVAVVCAGGQRNKCQANNWLYAMNGRRTTGITTVFSTSDKTPIGTIVESAVELSGSLPLGQAYDKTIGAEQ